MRCDRCSGFMLPIRYYDYGDSRWCHGNHCIHCGEVIDPIILANREIIPEYVEHKGANKRNYELTPEDLDLIKALYKNIGESYV